MPFNFFKKLFEFILPPRRTEDVVARLMLDELLTLQTEDGLPYSDKRVRALVWELKYHANAHAAALAGQALAEELLAIASEELGRPLLLPVPMHKTRKQERGHNQTELLCDRALQSLGEAGGTTLEYAPTALVRTNITPEQQKLDRSKRLKNVAGSMEADPNVVRGRVCVVVDDVTTTGATLAEAKRALKEAGAQRVHTIALARS